MQYAVTDIHGCYDKYIQLLRRPDLPPVAHGRQTRSRT